MTFPILDNLGELPAPFDAERARVGRERWCAAAKGDERAMALAAEPAGQRLLDAVFGNSPFLTRCLARRPELIGAWAAEGPEPAVERALALLTAPDQGEQALMATLRRARLELAFAVALADIAGLWPLERITAALSGFAERAIATALAHLLRGAEATGRLGLDDRDSPERASGVIVLGLGKLGGGELNYSSDVDLMVLWDDERLAARDEDGPQSVCVRLTRGLVRLLQERTADGHALRTDLRLRPDPGATPLALSVDAAELYYEGLGQNWERAALIKARPVAGDLEAGDAFLQRLTPFIWRRNLDFAAIQDIHSIKRQIHAYKGGAAIAVGGHNVKLGRGGIREIEFFAQTQQLIFGGRDASLRERATCRALAALAAARRIETATAADLTDAYGALRRIEHRLQMIDDAQTHSVPESEAGLRHIATFLGYADSAGFARHLTGVLERVESHYADLFEESDPLSGDAIGAAGNLVFTGNEDDPDTLATLAAMGFADAGAVASVVRGWHHGRIRATRSGRSRELLTELMPRLLGAFAATAYPDAALMRFHEFLERLPAGVQLFSLFYSNAGLLDLVAEIMGTAPRLAEHLAHAPNLLDHVLSADFESPLAPRDTLERELAAELAGATDEEDVHDRVRRWTHDREFQLGVQLLRGLITPEDSAAGLTTLTDTVLGCLLPRVEAGFARRHGKVEGGAMAVLALGKYGARNLNFGSDLDIVFVYCHAETAEMSDGDKPLPASLYFIRLAQRAVNALTATTNAGGLFEIDMRLRPSGNAGPLASEVGGFLRYQEVDAWQWEHLALTKLRVVWGPDGLARRVREGVLAVLTRPRDAARLAAEALDMHQRIAHEHRAIDRFDVKYAAGGLMDINLMAQTLQLSHAERYPDLIVAKPVDAIAALAGHGLIGAEEAAGLIDAARLMRKVETVIRLAMARRTRQPDMPRALTDLLVRITASTDLVQLTARLDEAQGLVQSAFARHITAAAGKPEGASEHEPT